MMLAAWNDGIGSCIASMQREDDCKAVLGVPPELRLQHIISFGYPLPVDQSIAGRAEAPAQTAGRDRDERTLEQVTR